MTLSILALRTRNNNIEEVALELISKAKRFYNKEINVILPVGNSDYSEIINKLEKTGVEKIYIIKNENLEKYSTKFYQEAVIQTINKINPEILLIGATANGRDLAPRIASFLKVGLTADCTELSLNDDGKLAATRPTFGGSLMATILSRKTPQMATVRPSVFKKNIIENENKAQVEEIEIELNQTESKIKEINYIPKTLETTPIEDAEILIGVGKGIKTIENFKLIEEIAEKIGAKIVASRGLVEMGFCKNDIQVGQTGKTVSPKIYIACGISGAIQHIEGIKNSSTIIAINKDENAPIFNIADYKIIGDLNEIILELIEELK